MSRTIAVLWVALALVGCPSTEPERADPEQTGGGEIMFPDEAEDAARRADEPPASEAVGRAEQLLAAGEAEEARVILEEAVRANPADARAQLDLGLAHEMLGDAQAAEAAYRAAIAAQAEFPEALNNLGLLLREQDRLDEAIEMLRRAVEVRSDFASAHVNLALALEERGDLEAARDAYLQAVRFAPRDPVSRANLGLILLQLGDADQAAIELRRALPLARGNVAALQAIGQGLRLAGQPAQAVTAMTRAIEAREEGPTPALLSELALAQVAAGDRAAAEASLRQAIGLDARYATAHYLLGNVLAAQQQWQEAERQFQRYLQLEPDGPHAAQARERLEIVRRSARGR